jgi:hypothetical protein
MEWATPENAAWALVVVLIVLMLIFAWSKS